jgi:hypothetical protein
MSPLGPGRFEAGVHSNKCTAWRTDWLLARATLPNTNCPEWHASSFHAALSSALALTKAAMNVTRNDHKNMDNCWDAVAGLKANTA